MLELYFFRDVSNYEELKKTEKIIARKFDIDVDTEIIERLRKR